MGIVNSPTLLRISIDENKMRGHLLLPEAIALEARDFPPPGAPGQPASAIRRSFNLTWPLRAEDRPDGEITHVPTTDGRELHLMRYTEPEPELKLLFDKLELTLPAQPPPKITER